MADRPTLKTISELSGLAVPTVSRALGDAPDISMATKEKVHRIAREIGYVPNRAGVRLRTGKTNVISIVLSTQHEMMNISARLISAVASGLRGTLYHLNMTPFFPGDDPMKPIRYIVETASADAVIFNQIQPDDPRVAYLLENGFPFATHGRSNRAAEHAYYDFDNHAFARIGMERLAARNRKRVLLLAPPLAQTYAGAIVDGARESAAMAGMECILAEGVCSDSDIVVIGDYVADLVSRDPRIDGLLVGSPTATMAAIAGFERAGRTIGRDFDVAAKDAIQFLRLLRDEIMIVEEDMDKAGEFLAQAAIQAARAPGQPPMQFLDIPADNGFMTAAE